MNKVGEFWDKMFVNVPNWVEALILLVLAFLVAYIVKVLAIKTMKLLNLDDTLNKANIDNNKKVSLIDFIASLLYLITFALFVPGIFQKLGLEGVAEPVITMMNKLLGFLPNIVASLIILIIGLFIAKVVKELLIPVFKKFKLDTYLEKIGLDKSSKVSFADVLANAVYVLILIPVVIASLDALKIEAISRPAIEMLNSILVFIPRIVVAIIILFVGKFIAELVENLLEKVLLSIGTDKVSDNILKASNTKTKEFSLSKAIAYLVKYIIIIFFLVEGINILRLEVLTNIGNSIIAYLPYAISSVIIITIAILVGNYAESSINNKFDNNKVTALIVKIIIITIGTFITLYQLGIAKELVNTSFAIILGAFAVAFAIAFGIGGKQFGANMLKKLEDRIESRKLKEDTKKDNKIETKVDSSKKKTTKKK